MQKLAITLAIAVFLLSCGKEGNVADCDDGVASVPCSEKSGDEQARDALNNEEWEKARAILVALNAEETDQTKKYKRFPLLGAAYAGLGGVPITNLLSTIMSGASGGDGQINAQSMMPTVTKIHVDNMGYATETINNTAFHTWLSTEAGAKAISLTSISYQQKIYNPIQVKLSLDYYSASATTIDELTPEAAELMLENLDLAIEQFGGESGASAEELAQMKEDIGGDYQGLQDYLAYKEAGGQ